MRQPDIQERASLFCISWMTKILATGKSNATFPFASLLFRTTHKSLTQFNHWRSFRTLRIQHPLAANACSSDCRSCCTLFIRSLSSGCDREVAHCEPSLCILSVLAVKISQPSLSHVGGHGCWVERKASYITYAALSVGIITLALRVAVRMTTESKQRDTVNMALLSQTSLLVARRESATINCVAWRPVIHAAFQHESSLLLRMCML